MMSPRLKELLAPHLPHVMRMVILSASKTAERTARRCRLPATLERFEPVHALELGERVEERVRDRRAVKVLPGTRLTLTSRWRILEPSEVPRVCKAFSDDRAHRVFLSLMLTGLRRSELVGLRWRNVNLVEGTLRVEESKSEEGERLIALSRPLVAALAEQFTASPFRSDDDYVFVHPERGTRLDADWYRERFLEALASAGVEGKIRTFHDMRHTALTNLAAQTTKGYLHLAGVVFHDEASALERRLLGVEDPGRKSPERAPSGEA